MRACLRPIEPRAPRPTNHHAPDGVIFFDTVDELGRAARAGRLESQDWIFVPLDFRRAAGAEAWDSLGIELKRLGAHVQVVPNLARICVLSLREMNEGMGPGA